MTPEELIARLGEVLESAYRTPEWLRSSRTERTDDTLIQFELWKALRGTP